LEKEQVRGTRKKGLRRKQSPEREAFDIIGEKKKGQGRILKGERARNDSRIS